MTQGLLTITRDGKVVFKIVAGCDGYNLPALVEAVKKLPLPLSRKSLHQAAKNVGFGCTYCRVVQNADGFTGISADELAARYREKFAEPGFNPRWERGTADYSETIEVKT